MLNFLYIAMYLLIFVALVVFHNADESRRSTQFTVARDHYTLSEARRTRLHLHYQSLTAKDRIKHEFSRMSNKTCHLQENKSFVALQYNKWPVRSRSSVLGLYKNDNKTTQTGDHLMQASVATFLE